MVQILSSKTTTYNNLGTYLFADVTSGKHTISVMVAPNYIQVINHNASNRAWRGMGKQFASIAAAIANYKTAEIRDCLQAVADLAAEMAVQS